MAFEGILNGLIVESEEVEAKAESEGTVVIAVFCEILLIRDQQGNACDFRIEGVDGMEGFDVKIIQFRLF